MLFLEPPIFLHDCFVKLLVDCPPLLWFEEYLFYAFEVDSFDEVLLDFRRGTHEIYFLPTAVFR